MLSWDFAKVSALEQWFEARRVTKKKLNATLRFPVEAVRQRRNERARGHNSPGAK